MMSVYIALKLVHILSAGILFGAGAAIAFFMLMGWRSGDVSAFYFASRFTVHADWLFTTSAVIIQPVSGVALALHLGYPLDAPWLLASYALYIFIGLCWLPVVWIQLQVRDELSRAGEAVPARVERLMRYWFMLGWPAFGALIAIFVLMLTKPVF